MNMDKIKFQTNIAQQIALRGSKDPETEQFSILGKLVHGNFGDQLQFYTNDNRTFYLDTTVGEIINDQLTKLKVKPGEPIDICKAEVTIGNGRKGIRWQVSKVGEPMGNQPDGTFVVPATAPSAQKLAQETRQDLGAQLAKSLEAVAPPAAPSSNHRPSIGPFLAELNGAGETMLRQSFAVIDLYAAGVAYANEKYGATVTPDRVWSIVATVVIGSQKGAGTR